MNIYLVILTVFLVACGSGRSEIKEIKNHEPSDSVAVIKSKFKEDNLVLEKELVATIKNEQHYDFKLFWTLLSKEESFLQSLSVEEQVTLFSFHKHFNSCDSSTFSSYSQLAIRFEGGIKVLSDESLRPCLIGIETSQANNILDELHEDYDKTKSSADLKRFIDFILSEMKYGKSKPWLNKINKLSKKEWSRVGGDLLEFYQGENLQNLISAHIDVNGYIPFAKPLSQRLSKSSSELRIMKRQVGLVATLDFLTFSSDYDFGSLSIKESQTLLDNILQMYLDEHISVGGLQDNLHIAWNQMIKIRKFQSKIQSLKDLDSQTQLIWLSKLHQKVEQLLFKSSHDAEVFLSQLSSTEVDQFWFKLRTIQKFNNADVSSRLFGELKNEYSKFLEDYDKPKSYLNKVMQARLSLRILVDKENQFALKENYCSLVGHKFVLIEDFVSNIHLLKTPGCLTSRIVRIQLEESSDQLLDLKNNGRVIPDGVDPNGVRSSMSISLNNFKMADDASLFLPAIDLDIKTHRGDVDLGYISLSADQKITDKLVLKTPKSHDGIIVPVPLLVHDKKRSIGKSDVHLVPIGLIYQEPFEGQIWADQLTLDYPLIDGVDSGSYSISGNGKSSYIPPVTSLIGGFGQDWEKLEVVGGQPAEFDFVPIEYTYAWIESLYENPGNSHKNLTGAQVVDEVFSVYNLSDLKRLLNLNDSSEDQSIYFSRNSFAEVTDEVKQSYVDLCKIFNRSNNLSPLVGQQYPHYTDECLQDVANKTWNKLNQLYTEISKNPRVNAITHPGIGPAAKILTIQDVPLGQLENYSLDGEDGSVIDKDAAPLDDETAIEGEK